MAKSAAPAPRPAPTGTPAPSSASETIRVRATAVGYYDEERKRIGDVFTLKPRTDMFTELVTDDQGRPVLAQSAGPGLPTRVTTERAQTITAAQQFSPKWMERVDPSTPEKVTTGNEDLRRKREDALAGKLSGGTTRDSDRDVTGGDDDE